MSWSDTEITVVSFNLDLPHIRPVPGNVSVAHVWSGCDLGCDPKHDTQAQYKTVWLRSKNMTPWIDTLAWYKNVWLWSYIWNPGLIQNWKAVILNMTPRLNTNISGCDPTHDTLCRYKNCLAEIQNMTPWLDTLAWYKKCMAVILNMTPLLNTKLGGSNPKHDTLAWYKTRWLWS